jgi:hypothetical protein
MMKSGLRVAGCIAVLALLAACASQEPVPEENDAVAGESAPPLSAQFVTGDGTELVNGQTVRLATGGGPSGRLFPESTNTEATLYVTRDGSIPSESNNWSGPIDPTDPPLISATLEGAATYAVVAVSDKATSDPFSVRVIWEHEENPELSTPTFMVDGRTVSGSISIPLSDGADPAAQLAISCDYAAATLYITRDGSEPDADNYWKTQRCDGTFIWSPEATSADYRVVAVWQGAASPVAALSVDWEASE